MYLIEILSFFGGNGFMGSSTIGLSKSGEKLGQICPLAFFLAVPGGPREFEMQFWGRISGH